MLDEILQYLPILIPIAIIQLILELAALIHAVKHPKYKVGNKIIWILVILLVNLIGPILYFIIGRGEYEEEADDDD